MVRGAFVGAFQISRKCSFFNFEQYLFYHMICTVYFWICDLFLKSSFSTSLFRCHVKAVKCPAFTGRLPPVHPAGRPRLCLVSPARSPRVPCDPFTAQWSLCVPCWQYTADWDMQNISHILGVMHCKYIKIVLSQTNAVKLVLYSRLHQMLSM